jgi:hypothetical protein
MAPVKEKRWISKGWGPRRFAPTITASLVAVGVLAYSAGALAEDFPVPGTDQSAGPARKSGGGFEFRRKLSSTDNPYCDVRTYVLPDLPEQASSTTKDGRPVIVIDASTLKSDRPYAHFLMAHECCHHTLGHTRLTQQPLGGVGVQPFYYLRPLLKNMELDADACAVRMLKLTGEPDAIERGRTHMQEFGDRQTGAYYPTGNERAGNIARAAAED